MLLTCQRGLTTAATITFRGWYIRFYHSTIAMDNHLKRDEQKRPYRGWEASYGHDGPFDTEAKAREWIAS
jgi:hypothetical protein